MAQRLDDTAIINKVVPIAKITPHVDNFRLHPDEQIEQLQASHQNFGQYRSVVIVEQADGNYMQVAGHGIVEAMRQRGVTSVRADVLPSSTDEATIRAILVADNLLPTLAQDDEATLARLLTEQQDAGFDLAALGSDEAMLARLIEEAGDAILAGGERESPEDFTEYDEEITTEFCCPKCQYRWSGKPK